MKRKKKEQECFACNGTGKAPNPRLYLWAFEADLKIRKEMPEGARDLAYNLVKTLNQIIYGLSGSFELAFRRGGEKGAK